MILPNSPVGYRGAAGARQAQAQPGAVPGQVRLHRRWSVPLPFSCSCRGTLTPPATPHQPPQTALSLPQILGETLSKWLLRHSLALSPLCCALLSFFSGFSSGLLLPPSPCCTILILRSLLSQVTPSLHRSLAQSFPQSTVHSHQYLGRSFDPATRQPRVFNAAEFDDSSFVCRRAQAGGEEGAGRAAGTEQERQREDRAAAPVGGRVRAGAGAASYW